MRTVDLIEKKKRGGELTADELEFLIRGYTAGEIPDYQMAAFAMAVYFNGMTPRRDRYPHRCHDAFRRYGRSVPFRHSVGG